MMIALVGPRSGARGWSLFAAALAALAATLVAGPQASEAAERCGQRNGAPEVTLTSLRGELAYYGSQTEADLRRLYLKAGGSGRWHGWNPAGLTLADLEIGLHVEVRAQPLSRGRFCAELAQVDATLGYRTLNVYVARRYRCGACEYEQILDHENRHVAIFRDVLAQYGPRVRRALDRAGHGPDATARHLARHWRGTVQGQAPQPSGAAFSRDEPHPQSRPRGAGYGGELPR